ncbi:MAG: ABC transporter permease [Candidatus Acidiferrales bacterium]
MTGLRNTPILWSETWSLALEALRANKVRAMLTMLGVIIGSACIVLVVTVALAGKRYIIAQIEGVGANLVYAEHVYSGTPAVADEISLDDMEGVRVAIPEAKYVAGTKNIPMTVAVNGVEHPISLVGVTEDFQQIRNLVIVRGRYFDQDDMNTRSKVCLLTEPLAATVFPSDNPVGKEIRAGELQFTVIGVFRERVATFGQTEITREAMIVPFSLMKYYTGDETLKTFYVQADRPEDVPGVTRQVKEILQSRHRSGAEYRAENLTGILETARNISAALTVVLILIALIALAISGIGIMNIMLVTVTERTREIGIRKAVGAQHSAILYQFLLEALMISGTGALVGIGIAVAIPALINILMSFFPVPAGVGIPVSWISVVLAFVVSCSTGLLFGYLPANRAARLHPTESLRYE